MCPASAAADWLVSPYVGARFASSTTFFVGREGAEQNKFTFGTAVGVLSDGVFGIEGDLAFVPGFFEGGAVTQGNRVMTLMANVIVATPLSVTQYGLRPYLSGGAGLVHARAEGDLQRFIASDLLGVNVGGGALGPLSPQTSVRFDLRYFRNVGGDAEATTANDAGLVLSFWRGTVGLTFAF